MADEHCTCPTCHQLMQMMGELSGAPYWECGNPACPDRGMQRMWPDARNPHDHR